MNNLFDFQPPRGGEITLCEVDGRVHSMQYEYSNISAYTNSTDRHPKIHITREMLHPSKNMEECIDLFLPVEVPFLKQLSLIYYEQGFKEMLQAVSNSTGVILSTTARIILTIMGKIDAMHILLNRNLKQKGTEVIEQYSQTRNWSRNPIRAIAWHKECMKIAVAASDDSVRVYIPNSHIVPILKCKQQQNVTCMAWRPMSNSDIAVGCEYGIIIWNVDPNSVVTRPSANHAIIVNRVEHKPIISISWSPRGDMLMSVAAFDSKILLWDVELDRTSSLKRAGTLGNNLLKWSPTGEKVFSSTTSCVFRVWDCNTWQDERWNVPQGRVQTACWSPCGTKLLFATNEEPIIYAVLFKNSDIIFSSDSKDTPNQAVPLYDATKVEIDGVVVGGVIQCIEWDQSGNHLAVMFHDTSCIAVFSVISEPVLQLNPGFFIAGNPEEIPSIIAFQPNFECGTCLTIGWSSGRLQHFPIVYTEFSKTNPQVTRNLYEATITSPNSSYYSPR